MHNAPRVEVAEAAGVGIDGRDRPTEDRVVCLPNAVVLADGATALRAQDRGAGWYAEQLCAELAALLADRPDADLTELLGETIERLVAAYGLVPGASPSSTVAVLRWRTDVVDALVLADSPVVVFTDEGPQVVADERIANLPRSGGGYRRLLAEGVGYGPELLAALRTGGANTGRLRNTEGGFWVAEAEPAAASHAVTASWPRDRVRSALLASDGVSCGVDDYGLFDWPALHELAATHGPAAVLAAVRAAERSDPTGQRWPRPKPHDDQALVLVRF